ncbi:MAG: PQQ-binding-like beta-propeller repeat protein, partial [Bacteroidales bacterium]|nr:PQQ-binding-like beta-propeller repeat protein [Bacteroidales bacterium]
MTKTTRNSGQTPKKIRLKPMLITVIAVILLHYILPLITPGAMALGMISGVVGGLFILVWWTFFSRAPLFERWGVFVCTIIVFAIATFILDESIATSMVGMMFAMSALPVFSILFVVWAYAAKKLTVKLRRTLMFTCILISFGMWTLLRTDGMTGQAKQELKWRWSVTYENQFITNAHSGKPTSVSNDFIADEVAQWPGFRGVNRDAVVHNLSIETDWQNNPPKEIWRKPIGPGCSSFAIKGHLAFTQEQFDSLELVSCYHLKTGDLIWKHSDTTRFWDSHAGAGPRSTPTLFGNQVYTLGATGILNVLNEKNGELVWSCNAAKELGTTIPGWAYCGSPLVVDSVVIVAVSGVMAAYDISNGSLQWKTENGGESYSSPHLLTIDGIQQVLFLHHSGADSYIPSTG